MQVIIMDCKFLRNANGFPTRRGLKELLSRLPYNYLVASCCGRTVIYVISIPQHPGCTHFTNQSHPPVKPSSRVQCTEGTPVMWSLHRSLLLFSATRSGPMSRYGKAGVEEERMVSLERRLGNGCHVPMLSIYLPTK